MSQLDEIGIDITAGLEQVAYAIATDLDYNDVIEFIERVDEHIADSHFTDLLKTAVAAL